MIECYTAGTTNGQRVTCMLEETGLDYRPHWLDIRGGELRKPEFLALNPQGRLPVIVDHDGPGGEPFTLSQSAIICQYLADKTGMFLPVDGKARYLSLQWLSFVITDFAPASISLFFLRGQEEEAPKAVEVFRARTEAFMRIANSRFAREEFLAGDLSIADICLYPSLLVAQAARIIEETAEYEHLRRWRDTMAVRPAIARAIGACPPPHLFGKAR